MSQSNYSISKKIIQQTSISRTQYIQNKETNQIWLGKVFNLKEISRYDLLSTLEYNEEVFHLLRDNYDNSLYMQSFFNKNEHQYMIFQNWTQRLSNYVDRNPNGIQDSLQIQQILLNILLSICDVYAEDFMILNLRPEHIVKTIQTNQQPSYWKIESLVYDYLDHNLPGKSQYTFDYEWASNEEKLQKENLDDKLKDEQIVWYMGIIALRLVYGKSFKVKAIFQDSDINLSQLKERCNSKTFELIQRSVKANLKDRIPLRSFLNLPVFERAQISSQLKQKFIEGNLQRIKKSKIIKNSILQKISITQSIKIPLPPKIKKKLNSSSMTQIQNLKIFQELRWALQKCLYLGEIKQYTQSAASLDLANTEDKIVIRYLHFKVAALNLQKLINIVRRSEQFKTFRQSFVSKQLYEDFIQSIEQDQKSLDRKQISQEAIEYEKKMKILDPKKLNLLSSCKQLIVKIKKNIQNSEINPESLSQNLAIVNGKFFSSLKSYMDNADYTQIQNRGIKVRAFCYFILSSYILLIKHSSKFPNLLDFLLKDDFQVYNKQFLKEEKLSGSIHVRFADDIQYIRLRQFTSRGNESALIKNSKNILQKYFQTTQNDSKNVK